jgi:hypothetical protein
MPSGLKNAQSARHKALRKLGPKAHQHPPRSQRGAGEWLPGDLQVRVAGSTLERKAGLNQLGAPTPHKALRPGTAAIRNRQTERYPGDAAVSRGFESLGLGRWRTISPALTASATPPHKAQLHCAPCKPYDHKRALHRIKRLLAARAPAGPELTASSGRIGFEHRWPFDLVASPEDA